MKNSMIVALKFDTSKESKAKPFYFSTDDFANNHTGNMTFNQAELVKRALQELGATVIDRTE